MTTSRKPAAPTKRRPASSAKSTSDPTASPATSPAPRELTDADVEEFTRLLRDAVPRRSDAWWHYHVILGELGLAKARALVDRAHGIEADGGLTVETGERKRTLGGIFFALAREELGPEKWRGLRQLVRKRAHENPAPKVPSRPEPEVFVRRRGG